MRERGVCERERQRTAAQVTKEESEREGGELRERSNARETTRDHERERKATRVTNKEKSEQERERDR